MRNVTVTTECGGVEYSVTLQQFESLDEARVHWASKGENAEDVELGIINAAQEQNAKQGGKSIVRKVMRKGFDAGSPEFAEAVEGAQGYAAGYVIGSPRGGTLLSGHTKTGAKDLGVAIASVATEEQLAKFLKSLGIQG